MKLFESLPESIKDDLATIQGVEKIDLILKQSQLGEITRININNIIYGLFIGELPPRFLTDAIREEMQLEDAKAQLVAVLVRKAFVEPHIEFLTNLYQGTPKTPSKTPLVPQGNVVNLKQSQET